MRDDGFETFDNRNTAPDAVRQRSAPTTALGHFIKHRQMARSGLQMPAAEFNRISLGGMRQLIHETFIVKALLG